jgi:hypothetical protein
VAFVVHGNQAIQPGHVVQDLINNGAGAGYHRLLAIHDVYQQPVNLHITPTLASALQWAKADPQYDTPWRDGPTFNAWIRARWCRPTWCKLHGQHLRRPHASVLHARVQP